jgi:hypothetical protein
MGYLEYVLQLYSDVIAIQAKSDCADDQGELIKAVARNHSAFKIDHQVRLSSCLLICAIACMHSFLRVKACSHQPEGALGKFRDDIATTVINIQATCKQTNLFICLFILNHDLNK